MIRTAGLDERGIYRYTPRRRPKKQLQIPPSWSINYLVSPTDTKHGDWHLFSDAVSSFNSIPHDVRNQRAAWSSINNQRSPDRLRTPSRAPARSGTDFLLPI